MPFALSLELLATMVAVAVVSYATIRCLRPVAHRVRLLDVPTHRKQHQGLVPLIGGLSIYTGLLVAVLILPIPDKLYYLFLSASLILIAGFVDDVKELGVWTRILILVIACLIMVKGGNIYVQDLGNLFGFGVINIGEWGILFTIFAVVGLVNAFNMIDGIDGLAGSLAIIAVAGILGFEALSNNFRFYELLLVFIAALLPYLLTNLGVISSRKIFLGDAGSMFVGFVIAWVLIELSQGQGTSRQAIQPVHVLWCVAIPVFDTITVVIKRLLKKQSPFTADREHIHHVLIRLGYSHTTTLFAVVAVALGILGLGIAIDYWLPMLSFYAFIGAGLVYVVGMLRLSGQHLTKKIILGD